MSSIAPVSTPRLTALGERAVDAIAVLLGLFGFVGGLGTLLLIPYGLLLQVTEDHVRVQTRIYQFSARDALYVLALVGTVAAPAVVGLCLARRRGRPASRLSLSASAVRVPRPGSHSPHATGSSSRRCSP